jgi:hypothetical protein
MRQTGGGFGASITAMAKAGPIASPTGGHHAGAYVAPFNRAISDQAPVGITIDDKTCDCATADNIR